MRIWRVESRTGGGPYSSNGCPAAGYYHVKENGHPNATDDSPELATAMDRALSYGIGEFILFGFENMLSMEIWFMENWQELGYCGFYISEYEVPKDDVCVGKYQVIFDKRHATLATKREISRWLEERTA